MNMKYRQFVDQGGILVELMQLELSFVYDGLLEGSAEGAYMIFRQQIDSELASNPNVYWHGFSEVDAEVEERWSRPRTWPPAERVTAVCRSSWVPKGKNPLGTTRMSVKWYQDEGDPFERIESILRKIDWKLYARYELLD